MTPILTFFFGLLLLGLFGWYFAAESDAKKRWLGAVLTVLLLLFSIDSVTPPSQKIRLGLDLQGGTSFLLQLVPQNGQEITSDMLQQAVEVIRKRVDKFGVSEPIIAPQGTQRILVQIPGLDPAQIQTTREQLQQVAKLEFSEIHPDSGVLLDQIDKGEAILPPGYEIKELQNRSHPKISERLLVKKEADLTGEHVTKGFAFFDQGGYGVTLDLDSEGGKIFYALTTQLAPHHGRLAILLDGKIQSAPAVNEPIPNGQARITGQFSEKEARELASVLENPLRTPVTIEETRSVSPTLGQDSIRSGIVSGVAGLALVMLFVVFYYRLAGCVALVGLWINVILLFGMMAMFHFVLSLPGIAGIILTIGLSVDANVLLYERLREELKAGKSLTGAIDGAYSKAFSAIFDANATTLITAGILFWQASGPVRGFSVTLILGIIASLFSAILFTRTALRWMTKCAGLQRLTMADLAPRQQFNFLGRRVIAILISLALIGGSCVIFAKRGMNNFGIDFRGGDLIVLDAKPSLTVAETRAALEPLHLTEETIQLEQAGTKQMLAIRSAVDTSSHILEQMQKSFPDRKVIAAQQEKVGAQIGLEFAKRALLAFALGMLGILIFVTLRFEL